MKNLKNFAFGLLVAVLAVGFSAFKSVSKSFDPQWVYVQTDVDEYTRIPFSSYMPGACENVSNLKCSYTQPENDTTPYDEQLSHSEVSNLGFIESSTNGLYNP